MNPGLTHTVVNKTPVKTGPQTHLHTLQRLSGSEMNTLPVTQVSQTQQGFGPNQNTDGAAGVRREEFRVQGKTMSRIKNAEIHQLIIK